MKKVSLIIIILAVFVLGQGPIFAKSGNSSAGNSSNNSGSENRGQGKSDNSKKDDPPSQTSNKSDDNKTNQGRGSDNVNKQNQSSENKGQGRGNSGSKLNGRGKISEANIEDKIKEGSRAGKLKKLDKVEVKEATVSAQGKRHAIQGLVTAIDGSTITLVHQIHRDRVYKVLYSGATVLKSKESSGSATLQTGLRIIVVGDLNSQGILVAKRIFIIPGKAEGIFKRQPIASTSATPSASLSPTPSVSPLVSPTP